MDTINYSIKTTQASTDYLSIDQKAMNTITTNMIAIMSYFNELNLSRDKTHKQFVAWYTKPSKRFLFNTKLRKSNSPQSLIGGTINNIMFGSQNDFSLNQLEALKEAINTAIDIINTLEQETNFKLIKTPLVKIFIQEKLWENLYD